MEWTEPGFAFRVTFKKVNYVELEKEKPIANDYERLRTIANDYERLSVEEKKILIYLLDNLKITRKEATELLGLKNTKTYEILKGLVEEKGLIVPKGKGRSTYYVLNAKQEN